jgi:hypothetical protein
MKNTKIARSSKIKSANDNIKLLKIFARYRELTVKSDAWTVGRQLRPGFTSGPLRQTQGRLRRQGLARCNLLR